MEVKFPCQGKCDVCSKEGMVRRYLFDGWKKYNVDFCEDCEENIRKERKWTPI